jgi:hypothetical protein
MVKNVAECVFRCHEVFLHTTSLPESSFIPKQSIEHEPWN